MSSNTAKKRYSVRSVSANSHTSTPNVPFGEIRQGVLTRNGQKKQSPIINPVVLRPVQQPVKKGFSPDKVQSAFQNLFGGTVMTPSFFDSKNTIKAQPINKQKTIFDGVPERISSVFSPVPCQPQSETSLFGVRGDQNKPYSPFNKNELFTPKISPQTIMGKVFKEPVNKQKK